MFDGLLGRGLAPKGKPLLKLTKNRIYVLRKKRTATIKYLKKDLADLVSNGLDVNAYNRAGGLLDELRHLWKLEFVEKTCDFLYKKLSTMQKMAECPEDCRQPVSSLMFAASGFSELPELRELRKMFHEKYADSLVLFVNKELVESMSSKPSSLEKKVKLMEDVALEFSISWDSKAFEKTIERHNNTSVKEIPKGIYDKFKPVDEAVPKREEFDLSSKERYEGFDNGLSLNRKKTDASESRDPLFQLDKQSYQNGVRGIQRRLASKERPDNVFYVSRWESKDDKAERKELYVQSKQESSIEKPEPVFDEGDTIAMNVRHENLIQGNGEADVHKKTEVIDSEKPKPSSTKTSEKLVLGFKKENFFQGYKHEEEHAPQKLEDNIPRPPKPSIKSKRTKSTDSGPRNRNARESREKENEVLTGKITEKNPSGGGEYEYDHTNSVKKVEKRETERMMKSAFYKYPPPPYVKPCGKPKNEQPEASVYPKTRFDGEEENNPDIGVERVNEAGHHQVNNIDNQSQKRRSSRRSRRKENSRKGLHVLMDENKDSEEEMMDKLLMHYSKKPSSYEKINLQQESKSRRSHLKKAESEEMMMLIHQPARSLSLPSEQCAGPSKPTKTFARAASLQPERSSEAKHVHPKLPNYEDLAARLAELKGRVNS